MSARVSAHETRSNVQNIKTICAQVCVRIEASQMFTVIAQQNIFDISLKTLSAKLRNSYERIGSWFTFIHTYVCINIMLYHKSLSSEHKITIAVTFHFHISAWQLQMSRFTRPKLYWRTSIQNLRRAIVFFPVMANTYSGVGLWLHILTTERSSTRP